MSTYFKQTGITCPAGHEFSIRRMYLSAGFNVPTRCPVCRKQFNVAVPNARPPGVGRKLLERDIEAQLVKRVRQLGGEVRKVAWQGRVGAPDRVVMLPQNYDGRTYPDRDHAVIWVEVKAPGKAAKFPRNAHERAQHREHERMRRVGQRVEVVDSFERIEEILK